MNTPNKKLRVLSGIQPTGILTLGNYLGALSQWVAHQYEHDNLFCVVDLHTLTILESMSPKARLEKTQEFLCLYIACGIDPEKSTIFIQSQVRQHSELAWILSCTTPLGWLERMTQFKTKAERSDSIGSGLLMYPVLMAADILLYDTDLVPVGDDQKQHLEITCEIARRFNSLFGPVFKIPKVKIPKLGARIMGFDDPTQKMSKSIGQEKQGHAVGLLDTEKQIKKTIMSSVTDSNQETRYEHASAGVKNLINILSAITKKSPQIISDQFSNEGYGKLKKSVFEHVLEIIKPIQEKYFELSKNPDYLNQISQTGLKRAQEIAESKMILVRKKVGVHS